MNVFLVIAAILMILGACPLTSPIDLWKLGTAFVVLAWIFGPVLIR